MAGETQDESGKSVESQIGGTLGKGFSFLRSAGRKLEKADVVKDIKRAFYEELESEVELPKKQSTRKKSGSATTKKKSTP